MSTPLMEDPDDKDRQETTEDSVLDDVKAEKKRGVKGALRRGVAKIKHAGTEVKETIALAREHSKKAAVAVKEAAVVAGKKTWVGIKATGRAAAWLAFFVGKGVHLTAATVIYAVQWVAKLALTILIVAVSGLSMAIIFVLCVIEKALFFTAAGLQRLVHFFALVIATPYLLVTKQAGDQWHGFIFGLWPSYLSWTSWNKLVAEYRKAKGEPEAKNWEEATDSVKPETEAEPKPTTMRRPTHRPRRPRPAPSEPEAKTRKQSPGEAATA